LISKNELVVINRNEVHQFTSTEEDNLCIVVQINVDFFKTIWPKLLELEFLGNEKIHRDGDYSRLKRLMYEMLKLIYTQEFGYMIEINGLICQVLSTLIKTFDYRIKNWEDENEIDYARLGRILYFIEQNYMNKITLKEIAATEYLNEYYFSHFFKNKMGVSFQSYLKNVRLQKAHTMLCKTEKKMVEIAMDSGFSNVQTFLNAFKVKYGETPSKYKKNMIHKINIPAEGQIESNIVTVEIEYILDTLELLLDINPNREN